MNCNNNEILTINNLMIGYISGRHSFPILPPLSASAKKGEMVAVIGRNGIGKSTLLRTITGLQKPLGGSEMIRNENINGFSRLKFAQNIGYISTEIIRVGHMRVYDLVALGRYPYTNWTGRIDRETDAIIRSSIVRVGLEGFEDRFISELSDGERQRAMIARVLAQDTDIMIMDEPTAFLDIPGKYGVIKLIRDLTASGKTIIFSTHDLNIAVNQADKIWLITNGRLVQGAPEDLLLHNEFESLIDSRQTGFNPEDGNFSFSSVPYGTIYIEGEEGPVRHCTIKAVKRAGYTVTSEITPARIRLPSDKNEWAVITNDNTAYYSTLYDLVSSLKARQ